MEIYIYVSSIGFFRISAVLCSLGPFPTYLSRATSASVRVHFDFTQLQTSGKIAFFRRYTFVRVRLLLSGLKFKNMMEKCFADFPSFKFISLNRFIYSLYIHIYIVNSSDVIHFQGKKYQQYFVCFFENFFIGFKKSRATKIRRN